METTKIELELTDNELMELSALSKGIIIQNENSEVPIISLCYKIDKEVELKASQEVKAEVSISIQAILQTLEKDPISRDKIQDGFLDILEQSEEEKNNLQNDINNL